MKLSDVRPDTFRTAVRLYLEETWGASRAAEKWPADRVDGSTTEEVLSHFEDETRRRGEEGLRRYVLRLGNPAYPHMKLVFQEVLIPGEFFFGVDTHDDMKLDPGLPGYGQWMELKARNRELKAAIEARWRENPSVPTSADLAAMIPHADGEGGGSGVLVVDDEEDIANAVAALLAREGYSVSQAYDGWQALDAVRRLRPKLVVMDYQMPGLDGVEVCRELKRTEATREIPVLLATASMVDLSVFGTLASGFLMKPYNRDFLVGFVKRLVPPR